MIKLETILLIDDSDADNHFHKIVIGRINKDYTVKEINNSIRALDYLSHSIGMETSSEYPLPQLIFVDINMPSMNGFELLAKLRKIPDMHHAKLYLKIYMLSGSLNPDDKKRALTEFSDMITGFCVKPLTQKVLEDIIAEHF